ncbi:MAG: hydrogenase expression/formation protein HypE [Chloroflexi bacterium]|nr:hydrogenase expression/formation protein HypE [Chloroflexota bacterium]
MDQLASKTVLQPFENIEVIQEKSIQLSETLVTLAQGSGGAATHALIEGLFAHAFANSLLSKLDDAAVFPVDGARLAFTTDSYIVDPLFFNGGDIGDLAVNGTVNDLATSGAEPLYLTAGFIIEEGFPLTDLERIVQSMARAAAQAGVSIVTGDTRVVNKNRADKLFINTAGIGVIRRQVNLSAANAQPGDKVILSGPIGEHGVAIMAARGELDGNFKSDTAPLNGLIKSIFHVTTQVHCLKDPTRGGIATALNQIAKSSGVTITIQEDAILVSAETRRACALLGIDPLQAANEGKLIAIVPGEIADTVVAAMRQHPIGKNARVIGEISAESKDVVLLQTQTGGHRVIDMLTGDRLSRIC